MKLVFLGTTGYHPNNRRHTASLLLPEIGVALDAGTGMFRAADKMETSYLDVFLSHAHIDHVMGLTYLLELKQERSLDRITVYGEEEKLAAVDKHLFSEFIFPVRPSFDLRPLAGTVSLEQQGRLTYFPLKHPGGAIGFRLDWPDRSMAYVTDTTAEPGAAYIERIRGVDLLVHECYFDDTQIAMAKKTGHSNITAVAQLARDAKVGRMVLVHLLPSSDAHDPVGVETARKIFPPTDLGEDLMEIEF